MDVIHKEFSVTAESGDQMIVGGLITTNNRDRHGDIVEAKGVDTSKLQVLLENHDRSLPIGTLISTEERAEGVYARFQVIAEDAWKKIKSGLLPAFSIGFIPKVAEPMETGGWLYRAVEILEVSAVSVASNRESLVLEIKSAQEGNTMTNTVANQVVAPAVHTKVHEYSLQRAIRSIVDNRVPDGFEGEIDVDLRAAQPWREFGGCAVPITEIMLTEKQKREIEKASGVYIPTNLAVLTGTEHLDSLMALIDDAIGKQTLMGRAGVRTISGLMEDTVRIPRQTAMMSASYVAMDTALQASTDPAFSNVDLKPKFVGSVTELSMSAVLAQHPRVGTDFIGQELRRGLVQALEDAFLNGDNTGTPAEPDGLISLADDTNTLTMANATGYGDFLTAMAAYEDYVQETGVTTTWLLDGAMVDALKVVAAFTSNTGSSAWDAIRAENQVMVKSLNLPGTTTKTGFFGDFSYFVNGIWASADVAVNPYADSVFSKKATLLRVSMMNDYQTIDPKRILKVATTVT